MSAAILANELPGSSIMADMPLALTDPGLTESYIIKQTMEAAFPREDDEDGRRAGSRENLNRERLSGYSNLLETSKSLKEVA